MLLVVLNCILIFFIIALVVSSIYLHLRVLKIHKCIDYISEFVTMQSNFNQSVLQESSDTKKEVEDIGVNLHEFALNVTEDLEILAREFLDPDSTLKPEERKKIH